MQLFRRNEENKILTKEINTVRNGAGRKCFKRNSPLLPSLPHSGKRHQKTARESPDSPMNLYLQCSVPYEIKIFLILSGQLIIVEREAFRGPADQKPCAEEKDNKLKEPVDGGIGFPVLPDPFVIQAVGAAVNPFPVGRRIGKAEQGEKPDLPGLHMAHDDSCKPRPRIGHGEKHFPRGHDDAQGLVVRQKDKGRKRKKQNDGQADESCQLASHVNPADDIHNEKNQQQLRHGGEEVRRQIIEGCRIEAVRCVDQCIGKDKEPQKKRNIADAPERMQQIFPRHDLRQKEQYKALSHIPLEAVPVRQPGNSQHTVISKNNEKKQDCPSQVSQELSLGDAAPPIGKVLLFLRPE